MSMVKRDADEGGWFEEPSIEELLGGERVTLVGDGSEPDEICDPPAFSLEFFRYNGPQPEPMPKDEDCEVINGGAATASDLLEDQSTPVFLFRREIWEEVKYLAEKSPDREWGAFLILKQFAPLKPKYIAVDLVFPDQKASATVTEFDVKDVEEFYTELNKHPDYVQHMHCRIAHIHSHHRMGAMWSGTDDNQQLSHDDLGFYDDFRFYLVVNCKGDVRCSYVIYKPLLKRIDNIPVVVVADGTDGLSDGQKEVLSSWLEERVEQPDTANVFENVRTFSGTETEQYVPQYVPEMPSIEEVEQRVFADPENVKAACKFYRGRITGGPNWKDQEKADWKWFQHSFTKHHMELWGWPQSMDCMDMATEIAAHFMNSTANIASEEEIQRFIASLEDLAPKSLMAECLHKSIVQDLDDVQRNICISGILDLHYGQRGGLRTDLKTRLFVNTAEQLHDNWRYICKHRDEALSVCRLFSESRDFMQWLRDNERIMDRMRGVIKSILD